MHRFKGAIAAPIMVGLFMAVAGCGAAAAASGTSHSAALTSGAGSRAAAVARVGPVSSPTRSAPPVSSQSGTASTAFPGIWDITTWQAYRAAQASVLQGHQPWLLDPELVVRAWASQWTSAPVVRKITANTFEVTTPGTNVVTTVRGICPDPTSAAPIWVITAISHS